MGEENSGDPQQRTKRMAAAAYDYSSDPRWSEYWSNVLIPPHMASRSDVVDHYKRKFYQRFIDPDLVVEAMSTTSSSQSASASVRSSSPPATENTRPRTTTTASGTGTSTTAGTNSNSLRLDRRTIHFSVNAWILIVAVLGVLPLVSRNISNKAYRLSLLGTALSSFYSLYALYGKPRAWTIPAVQTWFQSVIATKDFIQLTYSLMLVSSQIHFKFALIPVLCRALDHVAIFLRRNFTRSSFYRRRKGYELMVGPPKVINKRVDDKLLEPFEIATIEVPEHYMGPVVELMGKRRGQMFDMQGMGFVLPTFHLCLILHLFIFHTRRKSRGTLCTQ